MCFRYLRVCVVPIMCSGFNSNGVSPARLISKQSIAAGDNQISASLDDPMAFEISYDGTDFRGWSDVSNKDQPEVRPPRTVQGVLTKYVERLYRGLSVNIDGASRTDAGVHAAGQVVSFRPPLARNEAPQRGDPEKIMFALNCMLPPDLKIKRAWYAASRFHPTLDAKGKEYSYSIETARVCEPMRRQYLWHRFPPPALTAPGWDSAEVREAASMLVGTHDFTAFRGAPRGSARKEAQVSAVCTLSFVELTRVARAASPLDKFVGLHSIHEDTRQFEVVVRGDRFVYKMVRNIVGALTEVAEGKKAPGSIRAALETGVWPGEREDAPADDPKLKAGRPITAPPQGLVLRKVFYEDLDGKRADSPDPRDNGESRKQYLTGVFSAAIASITLLQSSPTLAFTVGMWRFAEPEARPPFMKTLASVLRCQKRIQLMTQALGARLQEVEQESSRAKSEGSVGATVLGAARLEVKQIMKSSLLAEKIDCLVSYLKDIEGYQTAQTTRLHGREAIEYLTMIVEFDSYDDLDQEWTGKLARAETPEKLKFVQAAASKASAELGLFIGAFGEDVLNEARLLAN